MDKLSANFNGVSIAFKGTDLISLTDLWKANGSIRTQNPNFWISQDDTKRFIEILSGSLNATKSCIIKTTRGKGGGTWAHWQIALAYAKYLSPELHMYVNQVFKERLEEDANPELAYSRGRERAIAGWKKKGKPDGWIANRIKGIDQRKIFTSTLSKHGVTGSGFGLCTDNIHEPILGKSTQLIKQELGIKKGDSVRNHIGNVENIGISLAEALASERIDSENFRGTGECSRVCLEASTTISRAINEARLV